MFELIAQTATPGVVESINAALVKLRDQFTSFLPGLIGGLVIFLVGWVIAMLARRLVSLVLSKLGLDNFSSKIGLKNMLAGIGLRAPLPVVLGKVLFWLIIFIFLMTATQVVPGLKPISDILSNLGAYLPRLASAVLFAMAGLLVAQFARGAVLTGAERLGLDYASALANLLYGFLAVVVVTLAIGQMEIETELLSKTVQIMLAGVALAFALALGLGLRPLAQNIAFGAYVRDHFRPGTVVTWAGQDYTVASVSATSTRLEKPDGAYVVVPNSELMGAAVTGRKKDDRAK